MDAGLAGVRDRRAIASKSARSQTNQGGVAGGGLCALVAANSFAGKYPAVKTTATTTRSRVSPTGFSRKAQRFQLDAIALIPVVVDGTAFALY